MPNAAAVVCKAAKQTHVQIPARKITCCVNKRVKEPMDTPKPPWARFHPIFRI